jgi:hypothetical protein
LLASKVEHEWIMLEGTHHFDVVKQALPIVIDRVQAKFSNPESNQSNDRLAKP